MSSIVLIWALVLILLYASLVLMICAKFKPETELRVSDHLKITVLIPCRNEAAHIEACLQSVLQQKYKQGNLEVLVIDDDSSDRSAEIVAGFKGLYQLRLIRSKGSGKKQALLTGVQLATHPYIYTTDADSVLSDNTLGSLVFEFMEKNLKFLCGPIRLQAKDSLFSQLQAAESAALVGISASTLNAGYPTTCNGANLLFEKQAFFDVGAYGESIDLASGDDDLLMHHFYHRFARATAYALNKNAFVETGTVDTWTQFINQRRRWASKRTHYFFPYNRYAQALVVLQLMAFYSCLFLIVLYPALACLGIFLKYGVDFYFAYKLKPWMPVPWWCIVFMPFYQLYYWPVIVKNKKTYEWKGRRY